MFRIIAVALLLFASEAGAQEKINGSVDVNVTGDLFSIMAVGDQVVIDKSAKVFGASVSMMLAKAGNMAALDPKAILYYFRDNAGNPTLRVLWSVRLVQVNEKADALFVAASSTISGIKTEGDAMVATMTYDALRGDAGKIVKGVNIPTRFHQISCSGSFTEGDWACLRVVFATEKR
jgi:hypothetical protein